MAPKKQKTQAVTDAELQQKIEVTVVAKAAEVTKAVFKELMEEAREGIKKEVKQEIEGKIRNLIYAGAFVALLFLVGILVDSHYFKANYNQLYLETQKQFSEKREEDIKADAAKELERLREMDAMKQRQDYLEKLLLERPTTQIIQPVQAGTEKK